MEELRIRVARILRKSFMNGPEGEKFNPATRNILFDDLSDERQAKWLRMADAAIEEIGQ